MYSIWGYTRHTSVWWTLMCLAWNNAYLCQPLYTFLYCTVCINIHFILLCVQSAKVWLGGLFTPEAYITAMRQHVARAKKWSLEELCLNVSNACLRQQLSAEGCGLWENAGTHLGEVQYYQWSCNVSAASSHLLHMSSRYIRR